MEERQERERARERKAAKLREQEVGIFLFIMKVVRFHPGSKAPFVPDWYTSETPPEPTPSQSVVMMGFLLFRNHDWNRIAQERSA
jgi:hypothetical protein